MMRITRDVIESYVACHYKAFLKLAGHKGVTPDNPRLLLDGNSRFPFTPIGGVHLQHVKNQTTKSVELTSSSLSKGAALILDGIFETDLISLHIEGLQRVAGSSDIGDFHYLPFVFQSGAEAHESQRVLLDLYAFILSRLQGRVPDKGVIWKGAGKSSAVQLSPGLKRGERILNARTEEQRTEQPPMLILNKHCQICEFQSRCHAQAVEEDNLSLLRGISEAEIVRLRKKGIFTINQLSYTFRPRRIKKRAKNPAHPHYFALQALALREKHVFVHGSPSLNAKEVRVYMDFEGIPANRSYYLIGLLVTHAGAIHQRSFWADGDDGEAQIFMEMLDYIKPYRNYSVLSETGYVWCITNGRSVYYFYRNSREGSFLADMFKNFGGVLVSDFYTAYDSLDCRQQRCLVHLMRDFNEEMQEYPFDSELKLIAAKFSAVLKGAVSTIDEYGFKGRHLAKHKRAASNFCRWASNCEFGSLPAERFRSRIVKYQNHLFTFLDQDGVSWNNTNAEHFIKPFARYRRAANGIFTERSIKDYLVILSIAETSRGRGEDFLEYLLRDNEHVFSFRSGRRASAKAASDAPSFSPSLPVSTLT
jgi:predicted RecB family nuclease